MLGPVLLALACRPNPSDVRTHAPTPEIGPTTDDEAVGVVRDGTVVVAEAADLRALAGVAEITGDLRIERTALATVALPDLRQIGGSLVIWENDALVETSFPALERVGGDLSLYDDPLLASLAGFPALRSVGGTLSVNRMPAVVDLDGLGALETAGALYLFHDTALSSLLGLDALRTVSGPVDLWELPALASVGSPTLETIGGRLDLFDADRLDTIDLPALVGLGGYELQECGAMVDVGTFPALRAIPGAVKIHYDDALSSLSGFAAVEEVGELTVRFDGALSSLAGLAALERITGLLELDHLDALQAIDLQSLRTVGSLKVDHDDALVAPGLPVLAEIDGEVVVVENPSLSQCALDALFDRITAGAVTCGANLDDGCVGWCVP